MFQLWKLVLLCGLLTGASASLLGDVVNIPVVGDVVNSPVIGDVVDSLKPVGGVLQEVKSKLDVILQLVQGPQNSGNCLLSDELKLLNINIINLAISDIRADPSSDGQGLILRTPVTANVTVKLPIIGTVVNLQFSSDLLTSVKLGTDGQAGLSCTADSNSISLSLLDRQSLLINKVLDSVTGLLKKAVSYLLQCLVCPLIQVIVSQLSTDLLQNLASNLLPAASL